ncbi:MAG: hypothetical protein ACOCY5_01960 [Desulfohalobiaceae bacterium]
MDKKRIKELAKNPAFIPGIYNYCDRWCEKCAFSARCMNFAMEQEFFQDQESADLDNAAFWESMSEMLELTQSLLYDLALEMHIDLDAAFEDQENVEDRDFEKAKEHICSILGEKYLWKAKDWLDSWECFDSDALVQIPGTSPASRTPRLQEAQEILCRYLFLIQAKIMRALQGKAETEQEAPGSYDQDAAGSAKVALICIDRSLAAWGVVYEHMQEGRQELSEIMLLLERLRRKVEAVFPEARDFIRPGFDETQYFD